MRIVIVGSGVVGVTSAWYLTQAGHEVTVLDRRDGPARETSFANAGEISPGYASPWASPKVPAQVLRWLLMRHSPLIIRPRANADQARWLMQMLRNCTSRAYSINKERMVRLAEYSRDQLIELRSDTGIRYDERALGTLQLFRTQRQLDGAATDVAALRSYGVSYDLLDAGECIRAEPGLAHASARFVGGLRLPADQTGDCFLFSERLAALAQERGARFLFGHSVTNIVHGADRIAHVNTNKGQIRGDAYLIAAGSFSPMLMPELGIELPIYPVKGYSITAPIRAADRAPVSTVLDETYKVALTRLGDRIRVGGMAEVTGYDYSLPPARRATLENSLRSLFPDAGDLSDAHFWCGLRPMTPDSVPIVGPTPYRNLFVNTGHGTLGWTMACGSARILTDLIDGRTPAIRTDDLGLGRYRRP